jgi:hypothetical protein
MGYDWNKYNQTHYDHDNPPPKVVQGYKFNVFYPELIDKTKAPTYKIEREGGRKRGQTIAPAGEEDTCLIRFMAGPPYEDIAFRIVDREWDYSAKKERGFRSSFENVRYTAVVIQGVDDDRVSSSFIFSSKRYHFKYSVISQLTLSGILQKMNSSLVAGVRYKSFRFRRSVFSLFTHPVAQKATMK